MTSITKPIEIELFTWMKVVRSVNTGKSYYMIGMVKDRPHTLLVTLVNGNGGAVMFCQTHNYAYPIMLKCVECQNAPLEAAPDADVTSCDTPKIER